MFTVFTNRFLPDTRERQIRMIVHGIDKPPTVAHSVAMIIAAAATRRGGFTAGSVATAWLWPRDAGAAQGVKLAT